MVNCFDIFKPNLDTVYPFCFNYITIFFLFTMTENLEVDLVDENGGMNQIIKDVCLQVFDFKNPNEITIEMEKKYELLNDLCLTLVIEDNGTINKYCPAYYCDVLEIIDTNLSEDLPPPKLEPELINFGPGFNKIVDDVDPRMYHLKPVYDLLSQLTRHLIEVGQDYSDVIFDFCFIEKLFNRLRSRDEEERNMVRLLLMEIYTNNKTCRSNIFKLIMQEIITAIGQKSNVFFHIDNLIDLLYFIIENHEANELENSDSIYRILVSLHRLPYLYYYYEVLFSCCVSFLEKFPNKVQTFTFFILHTIGDKTESPTNRIMFTIEIIHILNLLKKLYDQSSNEDKNELLKIVDKLMPAILKMFAINLQTLNTILINYTLKQLSNEDFVPFYTRQNKLIREIFLPIFEDESNFIQWESTTFCRQILTYMHLIQIPK